jgi:hypothetical protein
MSPVAQQLFLLSYGDDPSKILGLKSPFINLGLGKRYVDTFSKFEALREWLRRASLSDLDVVCFVDGYDVVQKRTDLDEFVTRFKEFGADLVFGAETHCWPSPWMAHMFPEAPRGEGGKHLPYRYPNCGTYMGYVWAVKRMLEWDEYRMSFDDQGLVHDFYLGVKDVRCALDYRQTLFQTGTFVPWSELDNTQAWFVHFNGKSHLGVGTDGSSFCVLERYIRGEPIGGLRQLHLTLEEQRLGLGATLASRPQSSGSARAR